MATIETDNVETYVKRLISEVMTHGANRNNHQQNHIHSDGIADTKLSRPILDSRLEPEKKKA